MSKIVVSEVEQVAAPIDRHFATAMMALVGCVDPLVQDTLQLLMAESRTGNVCLSLSRHAGLPRAEGVLWPDSKAWMAALLSSGLASDGAITCPLVVDAEGRLYLRRAWRDEVLLAQELAHRAGEGSRLPEPEALRARLVELFGPRQEQTVDWQRAAAALAVASAVAVIAGGPGTGKTTTVVRVLALLIESALAQGQSVPRCLLLAPTGKAAGRLAEATSRARAALAVSEVVRAAIPSGASTIHRALGLSPQTGRPRHDRHNPLAAEVVVVDEASMVDSVLMRRLVEAIAPSARLLLLGDPDQLASVEAGSVLGEVCQARRTIGGAKRRDWLQSVLGQRLDDADRLDTVVTVATLKHSYRFDPAGGIGAFVQAIRDGSLDGVERALKDNAQVSWVPGASSREQLRELTALGRKGFAPLAAASTASEALAALDRFRILAGHRGGRLGVEGLVAELQREQVVGGRRQPWAWWPLLVLENQPLFGLYNGDVGVAQLHQGRPHLGWFHAEGGPRSLGLGRLPRWEAAFAMTVHKSQGSEFDEVVVVLPEPGSPLLTREWLYTAVSRAKTRVTLLGDKQSIAEAVGRRTERTAGLGAQLSRLAVTQED
jgi:exodeoxyribonuclease V alpha subunit